MSTPQSPTDRTPERIGAFIRAFFGPGNTVWPDQDPTSDAGQKLAPLLQVLRNSSQVPVVLPRRRPEQPDRLIAYVVALDAAHATAVSEMLIAFIGHSYTTFDGRLARLDASDPVDRAVLEFAGPQAVFTIAIPTRQKGARAWSALQLLQQTVAKRPLRSWHVPKPLGRLLAEFEVALAAGNNSESATLLEQISASGGLTGTNVAHLRVKRLGRLGRDGELLRMPELADLVASDPPVPVKDAVLAAIYATTVTEPLAAGGLAAARASLIERGHLVPALANSDPSALGPEAIIVLALAAWIRNDHTTTERILAIPSAYAELQDHVPDLLSAMAATQMTARSGPETCLVAPVGGSSGAEKSIECALPAPASWPDLVSAVADGRADAEAILTNETWRAWEPPVTADKAIAAILAELDDAAAEMVWSIVGPFVDADAYRAPAASVAQELINNALTHDRFSPGDLTGLVALTEIVLRAAPNRNSYASLLDDLRAETDRWVGPERAITALDLVSCVRNSSAKSCE